jgi:hypothetical protein
MPPVTGGKEVKQERRYWPSSLDEDHDPAPPWWIAPAIAGGAVAFTLIVLWLAGAL